MNCDIMNNKILSANWFTRQLAAGFTFDPVVAQAPYSLRDTTCKAATTSERRVAKSNSAGFAATRPMTIVIA